MELKDFQRAARDTLAKYLDRARSLDDPEQAFNQIWREIEQAKNPAQKPPPYRTIQGLPGVPNVCIRLPTGGGKTLLAANGGGVKEAFTPLPRRD